MSLKDIFGSKTAKITSNQSLDTINSEIESQEYAEALAESKKRVFLNIDFSDPANFAKYGSAKKYYFDTIDNILKTYPYDGSFKEKQKWTNEASELDLYFLDNVYPKYKGYVSFSPTAYANNTTSSQTVGGYKYSYTPYPQYLYIDGRLRKDPNSTGVKDPKKSNVYDETYNRQSNLEIDIENGNTVEFFFKCDDQQYADRAFCLFDVWDSGSNRLLIELKNGVFNTVYSASANGNTGSALSITDATWVPTSWNHYAFTFLNTASGVDTKIYINGEVKASGTFGTQIQTADLSTNNLIGTLGAYQKVPVGGIPLVSGSAYGSFDEFRYWKRARTDKQIYRNHAFSVGGGANTDDKTSDLGVYYKFNEGILSTAASSLSAQDTVCVDYSGRIANGVIYNYSYSVRQAGSAIDEITSNIEESEPILYLTHPQIQNLLEEYELSGTVHDDSNVNSLVNMFPAWIFDEDQGKNRPDLTNFIQIISSYLDTLNAQMANLPSLKYTDYVADGEKAFAYNNRILSSYDFNIDDIFSDTTILEELLSRNDDIQFEEKLDTIKNTIYKNIYNNLIYIYKSKGTEKSFRNLIRAFGVDEDLVKLNISSNNYDFTFEDKKKYAESNIKVVDFNNPERFEASIYQRKTSSGTQYRGYLAADTGTLAAFTYEAEVYFPKKFSQETVNYFTTPFEEVSLFGAHAAKSNESDMTWETNDYGNFQVYAVKQNYDSPNVYFKLSSSSGFGSGVNLTSSLFKNVYDNSKWNFAVKLSNKKIDIAGLDPYAASSDYILEFYGVNTYLDEVMNEFYLSASVPKADAETAIEERKRLYAGAHKTNFTGSTLAKTDIKLSNARFWYSYLTNETIKQHAFDFTNYGKTNAVYAAYNTDTNDYPAITNANTLGLNWSFNYLTSSNASGQFLVNDLSSGSIDGGYSPFNEPIFHKVHEGLGSGFVASDPSTFNVQQAFYAKKLLPENIYSSDMIQVLEEDVIKKDYTPRPTSFHFSFEKNMYQTISEEMLKLFDTTAYFNNIVGSPVNKLRDRYVELDFAKQIFFDKVGNSPNLEKFIEFYKWIDSSIINLLKKLAPASALVSNTLSNVVESHILERNKINIHRGILIKQRDLNIIDFPIRKLPSYQDAKAPSSPAGELWYKRRAIRTDNVVGVTSGDAAVDQNRELIRKAIYAKDSGQAYRVYNTSSDEVIRFSDQELNSAPLHYDLQLGFDTKINKEKLTANSTEFIKDLYGIASSFIIYISNNIQSTGDQNLALNKEKIYVTGSSNINSEYFSAIGGKDLPFSTYRNIETQQTYRSNLHSDFYNMADVSVQSPFTEKHVGGNKHRHNELTKSSDRFELYSLNNNILVSNLRVNVAREEFAKRPINIKNIESTETRSGNYSKKYEFLQTSGRFENNKYNVDIEGSGSQAQRFLFNGDVGGPTGSRNTYKTIFVNKFSATGERKTATKAYLDKEAEELSVYNSINNRNLEIRATHNSQSAQANTKSDARTFTNFVPKNTNYVYKYTDAGTTVGIVAKNDNAFVSHMIPQSERQYSWITSSLENYTNIGGYISKYPNLDISENLYFVSSAIGDLGTIDFAGTNTKIIKQVSSTSVSTDLNLSGSNLRDYLLNLNGPYGNPSWRQVRNTYNLISRYNSRNNFITLANGDDTNIFKEPVVQFTYDTRININQFEGTGSVRPINPASIKFNLENELDKFANPELAKQFGYYSYLSQSSVASTSTSRTLDRINALTSNLGYFLNDFAYKQLVYPKKELITLADSNKRTQYDNLTRIEDYSYSASVNNKNNTWKSDLIQRLLNAPTGIFTPDYFSSYNSTGEVPSSFAFFTRTNSFYDGSDPELIFYTYAQNRGASGTERHFINITCSNGVFTASINPFENLYTYSNPSSSIVYDNYWTTTFYYTNLGLTNRIYGELAPYTELEKRFFRSSQPRNPPKEAVVAVPEKELFIGTGVGQYSFELYEHDQYEYNSKPQISPRPQLHFVNHIPAYPQANLDRPTIQFYVWSINKGYEYTLTGSKTPFFYSYEKDFLSDLNLSKYSLVPEFRISDHVPTIIIDKKGNFNKIATENYLKVVGTDVSSSVLSVSDPFKKEAVELFNNSSERKMIFEINYVKKFLPSKGFYPQERVLQIVELFKKSFMKLDGFQDYYDANDIMGINRGDSFYNTDYQALSTFLEPFFAPGILFNTIKSGIAVDWPVYISSARNFSGTLAASFGNEPFAGANALGGNDINPMYTPVDESGNFLYTTGSIVNEDRKRRHLIYNGDSNFRFPFESLLDIEKVLPDELKNGYLYQIDPTFYGCETVSQAISSSAGTRVYDTRHLAYPLAEYFAFKNDRLRYFNNLYTLGMHNFLASVPKFFLKDGKLNGFISGIQNEFQNAASGTTYYMDVILEKNNVPNMVRNVNLYAFGESLGDITRGKLFGSSSAAGSGKADIYIHGASTFGPPTQYWEISQMNFTGDADYRTQAKTEIAALSTGSSAYQLYKVFHPAYAPYAPTYYYGSQTARLSFTATQTRRYSLNEILNNLKIDIINTETDTLFKNFTNDFIDSTGSFSSSYNNNYANSKSYKNRMTLLSAINFNQITKRPNISLDENNNPLSFDEARDDSNNQWSIQTKFETPYLYPSGSSFQSITAGTASGHYAVAGGFGRAPRTGSFNQLYFQSIWTAPCIEPEEGQGLTLTLKESFNRTNRVLNNVRINSTNRIGSLIELCKFRPERKNLSTLAESQEIGEAIVMIPHTSIRNHGSSKNNNRDDTIREDYAETLSDSFEKQDRNDDEKGPFYFKVDEGLITELLGVNIFDNKKLTTDQIRSLILKSEYFRNNSPDDRKQNNILKSMLAMLDYNIPPHLNWVTNRTIKPFVLYVVPIVDELQKDDLANIWQGAMPDKVNETSEDRIAVEQIFSRTEFFEGKNVPEDMSFKIFKVKKKSEINYYKLTNDSKDDQNFAFAFGNDPDRKVVPEYSYNWPHDFYSLIEGASVDIILQSKK